jgi:hypothetical protein
VLKGMVPLRPLRPLLQLADLRPNWRARRCGGGHLRQIQAMKKGRDWSNAISLCNGTNGSNRNGPKWPVMLLSGQGAAKYVP